jgi:hypothetical protein
MMSFVHQWVRVQTRIRHNAVDEIVYDGRDAVNAAQTLIEGWFLPDLVLAAFLVCHISFSPFLFLFRLYGQRRLPPNENKISVSLPRARLKWNWMF